MADGDMMFCDRLLAMLATSSRAHCEASAATIEQRKRLFEAAAGARAARPIVTAHDLGSAVATRSPSSEKRLHAPLRRRRIRSRRTGAQLPPLPLLLPRPWRRLAEPCINESAGAPRSSCRLRMGCYLGSMRDSKAFARLERLPRRRPGSGKLTMWSREARRGLSSRMAWSCEVGGRAT